MSKLIPKRVTVESELKHFVLGEHGMSDGSKMGVEFEVPDGAFAEPKDLARAIYEEKEQLDQRVLIMEYLKGSLPEDIYKHRRAELKTRYDKLLKRGENVPAEQPKPAA